MRVLLADAIDPSTVGVLTDRGHDCVSDPKLTADDLPDRIAGFEALVVRSTKVTAATIQAADALELIVRAGAGTNTIDVDAASEVGIYVTNVPGRNAIAVAELTMGLLLAIDRRIADNVADLRTGSWNKSSYSKADGLFGKVMGIVGLGEIGFAVAERASAFGLDVRAIRKDRDEATEERIRSLGIELEDSLEELVATADIVSIHVPATPETDSMFDARMLGRMKEGAILLNTSRGDIVDEAALLDALETRALRAGLDVYPGEPGSGATDWSSKLAQHPGVDRAGTEGGRGGGRRGPRCVRSRRDPQLCEPRAHPARYPHPPRSPLRSRRRTGGRVRHPEASRAERRTDGESCLRG